MKVLVTTILTILLITMIWISPVQGQMATWDEAFTVAISWTERVIQNKGQWGDSDWAYVVDIQEFKRDERVIGYFCEVEPVGFIVVSLRKELAPIKAYSTESNLDPNSDEGMADLLKMKMEGILDAIEEPIYLYGVDADAHIQALLEIDYRPAWDELSSHISILNENLRTEPVRMNYQEGKVLLTSNWHQADPYNRECPESDDDCALERCAVGCVALAGAQIMRYWAWPPYHGNDLNEFFDWCHMPDQAESSWPDDDIRVNAVSKLCREIGDAVGMEYCVQGCESGVSSLKMEDIYENQYHYSGKYWDDCIWIIRCKDGNCLSQDQWFNLMKEQFEANRPIHYSMRMGENGGHSLVADGWREEVINGTPIRQYHMNYGMQDTNLNAWYTLDQLLGSFDIEKEYMGLNIYPALSMGAVLTEQFYSKNNQFNYRYFDQDIKNERVRIRFDPGQNLQFLPGVKLECIKGNIDNDFILFEGLKTLNTKLFSIKGMKRAGINIYDGGLKLHPGGSIQFH